MQRRQCPIFNSILKTVMFLVEYRDMCGIIHSNQIVLSCKFQNALPTQYTKPRDGSFSLKKKLNSIVVEKKRNEKWSFFKNDYQP